MREKEKGERQMGVVRVVKNNHFMVMDKTGLEDPEMSYRAKGLLAYCMSKPDDWTFYNKQLEKASKDGRDGVQSALKELKEKGYMKRIPAHDEKGKFTGWETLIYETPLPPEKRETRKTGKPNDGETERRENRMTGKPNDGKTAPTNNECTNNDFTNNDFTNNEITNNKYFYVVQYLNDLAERNFKHTTQKTKSQINARLNDGYTVEDIINVIDYKVKEWKGDKKMEEYLRPFTLFGTKFENYYDQMKRDQPKQQKKQSTGERLSEEEREKAKKAALQGITE